MPDHSDDANAKCLGELHLYLGEEDKLSGTGCGPGLDLNTVQITHGA